MTNPVLLAGGAEFGGRMSEPDLHAIELAGGLDVPIRIIPAAAAPDQNHVRAGNNGVRWFKGLGAKDVEVVFAIDRRSADDASVAAALESAGLVYLLGGFPRHLCETLSGSRAWQAVLRAHANGAVIAGSSAGAMVLCEHYYDPYEKQLLKGLDLLPGMCVLPHHQTLGARWVPMLSQQLPDSLLLGIDEGTGILRQQDAWTVYGAGQVTLYPRGSSGARGISQVHGNGETFKLP
ncbi:MAG: Type 1 glutamine amidotransferase-like domain-containing protein [Bacteroidota bacterium]